MAFRFTCKTCGEVHEGMPSFGADAPAAYLAMSDPEREERAALGSDNCEIEDKYFFVLGCLEIAVEGEMEPFSWGAWVSLAARDYSVWASHFGVAKRSHIGPFAGWLSNWLPTYPDTLNLPVWLHLRDNGTRPFIEVGASLHPLHIQQCKGITQHLLAEIVSEVLHPNSART